MKRMFYFIFFLMTLWMVIASGTNPEEVKSWDGEHTLSELLIHLGEEKPEHFMIPNQQQVIQGQEIVHLGRTQKPGGGKTQYVSKHYVCTTCHNLEREDPDLRFSDPETRLPYVKKKGIPFLQGTTFKGIVNRTTWYNDDYVKKYGDEKIEIAHKNLRESIQLCAIECSQGRPMEAWEIDAVLAYYWTLEWHLSDLDLTEKDFLELNRKANDSNQQEALMLWIKSKYLQKSPAEFYDAPPNKKEGYPGLTGNPARGKDLYELSCVYCHKAEGVSHYILDDSFLSFRHLNRMIPKDSHMSLYQIIAYGTYAIPGHRPYMPHYPKERMSLQQVEDLRAYIEQRANRPNH